MYIEGRNKAKVFIRSSPRRPSKIRYVDECLKNRINYINNFNGFLTLASCCGHNRYHTTIFVKNLELGNIFEYFTTLLIEPKKKRYLIFYQKDSEGFYFNSIIENHYKTI